MQTATMSSPLFSARSRYETSSATPCPQLGHLTGMFFRDSIVFTFYADSSKLPRRKWAGNRLSDSGPVRSDTYLRPRSVDVVLLPMEGSVGLDDDVFVRALLDLVDEHGFAGLERFADFRMHAERDAGTLGIGGGHLA